MNNTDIQDRNKEDSQTENQDRNKEESPTENQDTNNEESEDKTPSEESSSVDSTEKVHTSELNIIEEEDAEEIIEEIPEEGLSTIDAGMLIQEVHYINQRLDTITNILLVSMVGIALVTGILACSIFAKYFRS